MKIDILYFDGCPNHPVTTALVRDVVRDLGLDATLREVEVRDAKEAVQLGFLGSPTVRIDGEDIDPAARSLREPSLACRLYGRSGAPPRALVEQVLRAKSEAGRV